MPEAPVTTILFTDLVDSTGLLDRLGDDAAHVASRAHLQLLRDALVDHSGREVKSLGDGLMAAFGSPVDAVRCAVAMQRVVAETEAPQRLRVGIDAGQPILESDDMFGTPVVVARRLCDQAEGGAILVSGVVRGLVGRRVEAPMTPLGPVQVKGLSSPVDTWSVRWAGADVEAEPATGTTGQLRVVIADDQRLVRAGFRVILDAEPDITVVGEAADGVEAIELVRKLAPDVVLMDIRMPRMDGITAARTLLETAATRIVILTTFDADEYVYETLRVGASGFLLKDAPPEQLVSAVRCAARGDALIDPSITKRLIGQFAQAARAPAPASKPTGFDNLTARELDVFRLVARGMSNAEIAAELVVEETTVKTHVARVLMKLGVRDRVQAVVRAYESGLVVPG